MDKCVTGIKPGIESQCCLFLAVRPQAGSILSLTLNFFLFKMGTVMPSWGIGTQL